MKLQDWRNEIDEIDGELVRLVNRRAQIARKIGVLKTTAGLPVADAAREDEIMRKIAEQNSGALSNEALIGIFRVIIRESRRIQIEARVEMTRGGGQIRR